MGMSRVVGRKAILYLQWNGTSCFLPHQPHAEIEVCKLVNKRERSFVCTVSSDENSGACLEETAQMRLIV